MRIGLCACAKRVPVASASAPAANDRRLITSLSSERHGQHQPRLQVSGMRWQPPVLTEQLRESRAEPLGEHAPPPPPGANCCCGACCCCCCCGCCCCGRSRPRFCCQSCADAACATISSAANETTSVRRIFMVYPKSA